MNDSPKARPVSRPRASTSRMMLLTLGLLALSLSGLIPVRMPSISAQSTVLEPFDAGNEGEWRFGDREPLIESTDGNPGAYLRQAGYLAPAPVAGTTALSEFTGDYLLRQVSSVGLDLIVHDAQGTDFRSLTVMIVSGDEAAYFVGENIPTIDSGWAEYDFDIPEASGPGFPPGWASLKLDVGGPGDMPWNTLLANVDRLQYSFGNPEFLFIDQLWDIGLDNPRITTNAVPFLRGDANADGGVNLADAIFGLSSLFQIGGPKLACLDAGDANDDGNFAISDPVYTLSFLFTLGSPPPPPPFATCGIDPTDDPLECSDYPGCP